MSARLLGTAFEADMGTHVRKLLLLKLVDEARDDGTCIFPSIERIAKAAQSSDRHIRRELRNFEAAGLLRCVGNENGGRGLARTYELDLGVLDDVLGAGFNQVLAHAGQKVDIHDPESGEEKADSRSPGFEGGDPPEKGDTMSAFNSGEKGDIQDRKGGHLEHEKGDIGSTSPYPLKEPLRDPSCERDEKSKGEKEQTDPAQDELWQDFKKRYPTFVVDSQCYPVWLSLPSEKRKRAVDRVDGYLAMQRADSKHIHAPINYLKGELFDQVPIEQAEGRPLLVAPRSHDWWALFWRLAGKPGEDPFRSGPAGREIIVNRRAYRMLKSARENTASTMTIAEAVTHAEREGQESVEAGTLDCAAWLRHLNRLGYLVSEGDHHVLGRYIRVPKGGVPAEMAELEMERQGR